MVIIFFDVVRLVLVDEICFCLHRFFGIEIRWQHFIVDVDQFECLVGSGLINCCHAGHVVTHVANFVHSQRMFVVTYRKNSIRSRSVFAGNDGDDSFQLFGATGVNALNARVGERRMQDSSHQHAGHGEVIGVFAGSGGLTSGVHHGNGFSDY